MPNIANIVGIVKEISGSVVVKDELGVTRTLNLGDEILLGESVETLDVKSKVVISMKDGEEVVLVGEDLLVLDQNFLSSQGISNVFASADEISDLQKAIIEGKDLNTLEATAAGGGSIAGGEGTSLSSENFTHSGSISNVFEGYGDLGGQTGDFRTFQGGAANGSPQQDNTSSNQVNPNQPVPPAPLPIEPPMIKFIEDTNLDNVLNKTENDKDGKPAETTAHITIPDSAKEGDILNITIIDPNGNRVPQAPIVLTPAIMADGIKLDIPVENGKNSSVEASIRGSLYGNESGTAKADILVDTTPPDVVPTVIFTADKDNNGLLGKSENPTNTTEVKFTVPSNAQIGDKLVITIAEPGKEKRTEEIEITEEIKANGITKTVDVSEGELTQASAVIVDKAGNISAPGADEVTLDTTPPVAVPQVEFTKDNNNDTILNSKESTGGTTEVKFTVPSNAQIGDKLVITIKEPGKDARTEEVIITEEIKANGITKTVDVSEGELTQASAVIVDKAGNISKPGADEVTLDTTPPVAVPVVTFTADIDNNTFLDRSENPGSTTEVKFTVPSNAQIGDKLVITIAEPGKEKRTEEIEITEEIKANGITRTAEVGEDELTQASAVIVDKAGNISAPGADQVTLNHLAPSKPTVTFTSDKDDNGLLSKTENPGSTTEVKFTVPTDAKLGDELVIAIKEPGKDVYKEKIEITEDIKNNGITKTVDVSEGRTIEASAVIVDKSGKVSELGKDEIKPYQDIKVEIEVGPSKQVVIEDASKFANQMGLESKFYFVKSGEANIIHNGMNWGSEVNSVQEAKSYIQQRGHDAEYKTNKIDFNPGSDLISNSDSIENSHLKKFLGNNASDLKITDNGEYVNQPDVTGTRAINKISGKVYLEAGKQYTFKANSDDGLEVIINGKKLFANHPNLEKTHPVETAIDNTFPPVEKSGFYDISLVHYDIGWGYAVLQLFTVENGKDVAVGDYANGGLGLFNDTTGIRFDNGKFVKDADMYETIITGELYKDNPGTPVDESNPELTFFKQSSDGSRVEIGKVTVGDNGEYSFKYESSQKPEQGDKFIVEYRDNKGNLLAEDITAQMHTGKMIQSGADFVKTEDMDADINHNNSDDVKSQADNTKQLFSTDSSETIDISKVASLNSNPSSFESSNLETNHNQNPLNSLKQSDVLDEKDQNMLAGTLKSDKADDATKANESVGNNQDTASNDAQASTYIVPMLEQPTDIIS